MSKEQNTMHNEQYIPTKNIVFSCLLLIVYYLLSLPAFAADLSVVSDIISSSAPSSASTTHVITFTAGSGVPAGGSIIITPESGGASFDVPAALDFNDVDLAVAIVPGVFVDRPLAALPDLVNDGVTVVSGASGSVTFVLSSGAAIPAGATVQVEIGSNATFGAIGMHFITSPSVVGSYRLRIYTRTPLSATIQGGAAMIALITPVVVTSAFGNIAPAVRSNGLPTGLLPGSTANVWVSLNTDIPATCKYGTTSGLDYYAMSSSTIFTAVNTETLHYQSLAVATNTVHSLYVRCSSQYKILNPDDYLIAFEVGVVPNASTTPTPPAPPPPPPGPSGPPGPGGGGGLFQFGGDVTLEGRGFPFGALVITKDGTVVKEDTISVLGDFSVTFPNLPRGTYNWGVSVRDPSGQRSTTYTSTIYMIGKTNNLIAPIYLSPTISAASTTVSLGGEVVLHGFAIPLIRVQTLMSKQGDPLNAKIVTGTTTANGDGSWSLKLPTTDLPKGTYEVKAKSLISSTAESNLSPIIYIGLGGAPNPNFGNRSDLNHDGKVNLVDFSILLFNWKGSDAIADINSDGVVNLTDFSIMLSNWTG